MVIFVIYITFFSSRGRVDLRGRKQVLHIEMNPIVDVINTAQFIVSLDVGFVEFCGEVNKIEPNEYLMGTHKIFFNCIQRSEQ